MSLFRNLMFLLLLLTCSTCANKADNVEEDFTQIGRAHV